MAFLILGMAGLRSRLRNAPSMRDSWEMSRDAFASNDKNPQNRQNRGAQLVLCSRNLANP